MFSRLLLRIGGRGGSGRARSCRRSAWAVKRGGGAPCLAMSKVFGLGIPQGNERDGLEVPVGADCRVADLRWNVPREEEVNGRLIMNLSLACLCR